MKTLLAVALIGLAGLIVLHAQSTVSAPVVQFTINGNLATNVSQCVAPTDPAGSWCPVISSTGAISNYFWDGKEFSLTTLPTFTASATTLPVGSEATANVIGTAFSFGIPTGATGGQGPQGIPGPVQGFGTAKCPAYSIQGSGTSSSIVIGPGCVETTP